MLACPVKRPATPMGWTILYLDLETNRETRSHEIPARDAALQHACELLDQKADVHKIVSDDGQEISRAEIDQYRAAIPRP